MKFFFGVIFCGWDVNLRGRCVSVVSTFDTFRDTEQTGSSGEESLARCLYCWIQTANPVNLVFWLGSGEVPRLRQPVSEHCQESFFCLDGSSGSNKFVLR